MLPIRKLKQVEGRILTVIDAVLASEIDRCKATKDLIRNILGDLYSYADYDDQVASGTVDQADNSKK